MGVKIDLTGRIYGEWYVNSFAGRNDWHEPLWNCTCTLCGKEYIVNGSTLVHGKSKRCRSCSAKLRPENQTKATLAFTKSGLSQTKLYQMLANMHHRCEDASNKSYSNYGARGIKVCDEWSMEHVNDFYEWALANGYQDGLQIDRINVDGDYCPDNCRFVSKSENLRNTRRNFIVTAYGNQMTLAEAVEKYSKLPYGMVLLRIKRYGYSVEDALTLPRKKSQ